MTRKLHSKRHDRELTQQFSHIGEGWVAPIRVSEPPAPHTCPQEIFSFTPTEHEIFTKYFVGTPKEVSIRQIFLNTPLSSTEQTWIKNFREFSDKNTFSIPGGLEPLLLRLLLFNYRKYPNEYLQKTLMHAQLMITWRQSTFSISDTEAELRQDLDSGMIYWVARDHHFRPLLLINMKKVPKHMETERFKRLVFFCFEWALRYLMVPSKVETCSVLIDLRGVQLAHIPGSTLKDMANTLTKQYPFRLRKMFIINDSWFIQSLFGMIKPFLTEVQQQKFQFIKGNLSEEMTKHFVPHQLEEDYGGTRRKVAKYYPFPMVGGPFDTDRNGPNPNAIPNCHEAMNDETAQGKLWEDSRTPPVIYDEKKAVPIFKKLGLLPSDDEPMTTKPGGAEPQRQAQQIEATNTDTDTSTAAATHTHTHTYTYTHPREKDVCDDVVYEPAGLASVPPQEQTGETSVADAGPSDSAEKNMPFPPVVEDRDRDRDRDRKETGRPHQTEHNESQSKERERASEIIAPTVQCKTSQSPEAITSAETSTTATREENKHPSENEKPRRVSEKPHRISETKLNLEEKERMRSSKEQTKAKEQIKTKTNTDPSKQKKNPRPSSAKAETEARPLPSMTNLSSIDDKSYAESASSVRPKVAIEAITVESSARCSSCNSCRVQ